MSDFDPFDDELAAAMRRRSPAVDPSGLSTASAHDAVLARAHHIRRRRAGIAGGVSLLAITALGFVVFDGRADDTLAPASDPSTTLPIPPTVGPSTTVPGISSTTIPAITATTALPGTSTTTAPPLTTTAPTTAPATVAPTIAPTAAPPAPTTETVPSSGGSITYRWDGTALTLVSTDPAADHIPDVEDDTSTRIRVRFEGPSESRIEVRVEDGVPVVRID